MNEYNKYSNVPKMSSMSVVSNEECGKSPKYLAHFQNKTFCAKNINGNYIAIAVCSIQF
jgi:hypothetical protein